MLLQKKKFQNQTKNQSNNQPKKKKTMASLRLQKDITSYQMQPIQFVQLTFPQEETLQVIHIAVHPQQNSLFYRCRIIFELVFPDTYPIDPPKIKCLNKIYHPNITYQGSVCLPLVRQDYEPTVNLTSIICGLIFILTYPNAQDALNTEAGQIMQKNNQMYVNIVNHTIHGHEFKKRTYDKIKIEQNLNRIIQKKEKQKLLKQNMKIQPIIIPLKHSHSQSQNTKEIIIKVKQNEHQPKLFRKQSENQVRKQKDQQNEKQQFQN